jgi:8-oxo-dGTP pyrophosphatase MutT (NUDIX family)
MDRIQRVAARVLPVSPKGEVLMLQDQDPAEPGVLRWGTIGGATDPGESLVDAAIRELFEETGIAADGSQLSEPFRRSSHDFSWGGNDYTSDSTFFALPLDGGTRVSFEHLEESEVGNVIEARWWTPDDLQRAGGMVDDALPTIMGEAIRVVLGDDR